MARPRRPLRPSVSDDDDDIGDFVPGLDGDKERNIRYEEKMKIAKESRKNRLQKSEISNSIFDFANRIKEPVVAIEISSDSETDERHTLPRTKRIITRRETAPHCLSSDSDVLEIDAFEQETALKRRRSIRSCDPLLAALDFTNVCSPANTRRRILEDPDLRRTMSVIATSDDIIRQARAPILLSASVPQSPTPNTAPALKLPELIPLQRSGLLSGTTTQRKTAVQIIDHELNFFTLAYLYTDCDFSDLHRKLTMEFGKIWITIDGFEIDLSMTPMDLRLSDQVSIHLVKVRPTKGYYIPPDELSQAIPSSYSRKPTTPGSILLKFTLSGKQEFTLQVRRDDTFEKIHQQLCSRHAFKSIVFIVDGEKVPLSETPNDLGLETDDQVDIKVPR